MVFFAISLDEEKIRRDGIVNVEKAYHYIEKNFASMDAVLYKTVAGIRYFTREIDKHDFEYLWMVVSALEKEKWFSHYVKVLSFYSIGDSYCDAEWESLPEEWESRPTLEDVIQEMNTSAT